MLNARLWRGDATTGHKLAWTSWSGPWTVALITATSLAPPCQPQQGCWRVDKVYKSNKITTPLPPTLTAYFGIQDTQGFSAQGYLGLFEACFQTG